MTTTSTKRFRSVDWLEIGLIALAEEGPDGLLIGALTRRTGKTTGSFYAHFSSTSAFIEALCEFWYEKFTTQIVAEVSHASTSEGMLWDLNALAVRLDPAMEQGVRRLASSIDYAAKTVKRADGQRLTFLTGIYMKSGQWSHATSVELARIEYATFVGLQQIQLNLTPHDVTRMYESFRSLLSDAQKVKKV